MSEACNATYNAAAWLVDRHVAAGNGSRVAVVCGDEVQTYADVQRQVFRVQHALHALGVRREERVALVLDDEPAFPAWFLGTMRSGAVPVALSTMLTGEELGAIIDDARAAVVVLSGGYARLLPAIAHCAPDLRAAVVVGEAEAEAEAEAVVEAVAEAVVEAVVEVLRWDDLADDSEAALASTQADSPAFWLYSSGTTGFPKGVMHRHASLEATAVTYASSVLGITAEDRCFSAAKLFFAFGLGNSLTFPFSVGATTVLDPARATPAGVAASLRRHRPTLFFGSPGLLAALLDADMPADAASSVRLGATAGEALPAEIHRRFTERYGFPVLDGIGSTEALHIFLSNHLGEERPGTTGRPVEGYQVRLLDDDGLEVTDAGVPGYLHVSGESIATGYWCRTEATRAAFRGEWLRTGDVYTRSADGYYQFLGRNNDMIKVGGIWVAPAEVEGVLVEHPDVLEAAVVGGRTEEGLETAVAFVVARSGRSLDEASLEAHCRSRMAAFKRPRRMVFVDELPKTATGKVQRYQLRERLADEAVP